MFHIQKVLKFLIISVFLLIQAAFSANVRKREGFPGAETPGSLLKQQLPCPLLLQGGFMTNINMSALDSFSKLVLQDENAVLHRDSQTSEIKQYGTFNKYNIFRFMRNSSDRTANNEIRAQLLKSLGDAYGLSGAQVHADGKISFSADFMKQLESRLGGTIKAHDFKIGSDGMVNSGKPLTARRLTAILNKVSEQAGAVDAINSVSQRNHGISKESVNIEMQQMETRSAGFQELRTMTGGEGNKTKEPAPNNVSAADKKDPELPPGRIAYRDFKNIYTLGRGGADPRYHNRGEFYQALAKQHGEVFKSFEEMANKLIAKAGAEAVENAVAKINGSFSKENGIFAELFSCMFRPGSEIPLPLQGVSEKKTQNIQEFLKKQLDGIMKECINAHDSGKQHEGVREAAAANEAPRPPVQPLNRELFSNMIFEAMPDGAIDGSMVLKSMSDPVANRIIRKLTNEQGPAFVAKHGEAKVKAMISSYAGISSDEFHVSVDISKGLMNCLFIKGTDGEQKLKALLDNHGTPEELEALIRERLQVLENYTEHPETIPGTVDAGTAVNKASAAPSDAERNLDRVFKCSVNTAEYKDIGSGSSFTRDFTWLTAPVPVSPKTSMELLTYVDSEAKSLEDFDVMMQNSKGEKLDNFLKRKAEEYREVLNKFPKDKDGLPVADRVVGLNTDALKTLSAFNEITADFEKQFGKDAIKKVVAEAGGKYDDNSRPALELIKVIFTSNDKFSGQHIFFDAATNQKKYENNLSGMMNIFIDGLDSYVKRLHLQPLNGSVAV